MSTGRNHRRDHDRIPDNGPTWEGHPPSSGCNSTHVAKARAKWRAMGRRAERRTGDRRANGVHYNTGGGRQTPLVDEDGR